MNTLQTSEQINPCCQIKQAGRDGQQTDFCYTNLTIKQFQNLFLADAFLLHGSELHLYSKINIENVKINTRTVAVFKAQPTCIAQPDCGACVSLRQRSAFQCMWCEAAGHCSDGADR